MKWYLSCDVKNGLIDAIWKLMSKNGLKDAIRRSVDRMRYSFARARTPVVEEDYAGECLFFVLGEIEF